MVRMAGMLLDLPELAIHRDRQPPHRRTKLKTAKEIHLYNGCCDRHLGVPTLAWGLLLPILKHRLLPLLMHLITTSLHSPCIISTANLDTTNNDDAGTNSNTDCCRRRGHQHRCNHCNHRQCRHGETSYHLPPTPHLPISLGLSFPKPSTPTTRATIHDSWLSVSTYATIQLAPTRPNRSAANCRSGFDEYIALDCLADIDLQERRTAFASLARSPPPGPSHIGTPSSELTSRPIRLGPSPVSRVRCYYSY
ncbi:hypothetical protein GGR55DRAFT_426775 [Xylaria sp. FL0064]|nr:hypothetical protein GGR55DRAFT_426775 [Xylaria sp. FL0064]